MRRPRESTAVRGASPGGVISLYLDRQLPEVLGMVAWLSSTFIWRDDPRAHIAGEPRQPLRIDLDSGWPGDNCEATRDLHARLKTRGYADGVDLDDLSFPGARHDEYHWAMRAHVPLQRFLGRAWRPRCRRSTHWCRRAPAGIAVLGANGTPQLDSSRRRRR
jgi:enterochelin esterase-like enzyme